MLLFSFEAKKRLFCLALKQNTAKKIYFVFALKLNEKSESETKQNEKLLKAKQSENAMY